MENKDIKNILEYIDNDDKKLFELYNMFGKDEEFDEILYQIDEAVPYKDLLIYPIKVKFYRFFHIFVECLILPKHRVPNIEIIQMKYLDYLFLVDEALELDNLKYTNYLRELLLLCLRKERNFKTVKGNEIETIDFIKDENNHWLIRIENKTYNSDDFENIKEIICKQNNIEIPDITMHPDLEKKYNEFKEFQRKMNKNETGNFEDLLLCIVATTNYTKEEALNITIRSFGKLLDRIDLLLDYKLKTLLSPNMDEKNQKKIKHWMSKIVKQDKLQEMSTDFEEVKNKLNGAN